MEREAFDRLYRELGNKVLSYFLGQLSNREDALDLTQETFRRTWQAIERVTALDSDAQGNWVFSVARNVLNDWRRRESVRSRPLPVPLPKPPDDTALTIDVAMRQLSKEQRLVLTMATVGQLTSEEIGNILERPAGTIRSIIHEARKRLLAILADQEKPCKTTN